MKHCAYYPKEDWTEYCKGNLEPHPIKEKDIPSIDDWIGFYDGCDVYCVDGKVIVIEEVYED